MPFAAIAGLAISLLLAGTGHAQDLTDSRRVAVARQLKESTVVVRVGRDASGSGFVVGEERWIVTNAHVVNGWRHQAVVVRFGTGDTRPARVVAYDPRRDLAMLRVEGAVPVPPLSLGDADKVEVGQTVLAFGSPFGLEGTLTQGIVSARRDLPAIGGGAVKGLIQTDAPINPGNSGGPLVNAQGEVVGVNTAILSRTGGNQGIGFAVPANYLVGLLGEVRAELARRGRESPDPDPHGEGRELGAVWLGIYGDDFRARGVSGVRVERVVPRSPAARAGLLGSRDRPPPAVHRLGIPWTGHIILSVDGHPVRNMRELRARLDGHRPGEEATLFVTVGPGLMSGEARVRLTTPPAEPRHP